MKSIKYIFYVIVVCVLFTPLTIASEDSFVSPDFDALPKISQATLGEIPVTLEIADDMAERMKGLMYRKSMPENYGMLFVFEDEAVRRFWMKNTLMDLDIAFLDKNGVIVDIKQMKKYVERTTTSDEPAMYAVEMNAGWFFRNNVVKGDLLDFIEVPE